MTTLHINYDAKLNSKTLLQSETMLIAHDTMFFEILLQFETMFIAHDTLFFEILLQLETMLIAHDALFYEIKSIYAQLKMIEVNCIDVNKNISTRLLSYMQ